MMHPFRCEICGETYLGSSPPERCPFCGAAGKLVLPAAEWMNYGKIEMCQQSYEDCQKALELELNNYAYYKCAVARAQSQVTETIFKRLMKHELEHAEVFAKAMGIELPSAPDVTCAGDDVTNMAESNKHETMAIKFYIEAARRAPEPRIQQIFRAIAEVENEHLVTTNMYK
ncbi:MAG: rubredoxin-like domain-containing protein [Bacillota bacterium]|jgi:rubrerythrin|uniref:Rubrerythrin n=1 Tax=Thermanaerosceptrum fracticalcis TaxID=1712410 RepID=A0A7G6DYH1_THEFR|nr:ferritin family protein [Thermanaerosceptrum fracticalcis]QNB44875.1 rubrerythrin [Thermanaerosceptrum fracticalcis]